MSITCPDKDRPRVTAGATVPGVSAAPNVEEVRGEDLIPEAGVGFISTPCRQCDSVLPSAAASQQSPAGRQHRGPQGVAKVLSREGHVWSHNRIVSHALFLFSIP